jgi:hypothetical protein
MAALYPDRHATIRQKTHAKQTGIAAKEHSAKERKK